MEEIIELLVGIVKAAFKWKGIPVDRDVVGKALEIYLNGGKVSAIKYLREALSFDESSLLNEPERKLLQELKRKGFKLTPPIELLSLKDAKNTIEAIVMLHTANRLHNLWD